VEQVLEGFGLEIFEVEEISKKKINGQGSQARLAKPRRSSDRGEVVQELAQRRRREPTIRYWHIGLRHLTSVYSAGMLCINSYSHSALLQLVLLFFSAFHLTLHICSISSCASSSSLFLQFHSFSLTEQPTGHSLFHLLLYTRTRRFNFPTP
jgi:hypothetical protein